MIRLSKFFKAGLILLTLAAIPGFAQTYFDEHIIDSYTYGTCSLEAPDLDGDGDSDVLAAVQEDNNVVWWRNDGGGPINWTKFVIGGNIFAAHSAYAEDIDGDEDFDVIATAYGNRQIYWWRNEGGDPIEWTRFIISNSYDAAHEVYAIDLDKDGDTDVLGASSNLHRISWWRNDGGEPIAWTEFTIGSDVQLAKSVRVADLDGDDDLDVIGAALGDSDVLWWRNDGGNPILWTEYVVDGDFWGAHRVQAIDMDGDDDIDIVGAAYLGNQIAWWRNDGGEPITWVKQAIGNGVVGACIAMAADIDGDGDLDVAGTGQESDEVSWWRNDGEDPIVWTKFVIDNFDRVWPLYICDLNNDGELDILAGSSHVGTGEVKWYENLGDVYVVPDFSAEPLTGNFPLEVQFVDQSNASPEAHTWAWDFDDDGAVDSDEQFPIWIYDTPGVYTVSLEVFNDSLSRISTKEDYIHVFNGQSALRFNGETSFAICSASQSLNITNSLTIEAWIYPFGWGEHSLGLGKIIDKGSFALFLFNSGSLNDHSLILQLVDEIGVTSLSATPENSIELNSWQHVAATYDGISEAKLYINGIEQSLSQTGDPSGEIQDNIYVDLMIGNSASNSHTFDGIIDEVRIWNITRSGMEIRAGMNNYIYGDASGLAGYWRLDEGNGDIIFDSGDYANNGDIVDITWIEGRQLDPTAIDDHAAIETIRKFHLFEPFPNPFNTSTTIRYVLPKASNVSISIYDIIGRKTANLIMGKQPAGFHQHIWYADDIPSGIYFCRISADNCSDTKKMILIK